MVPVAVNLHLLRRGQYPWQLDASGERIEFMHYAPGTKEELSQYQGIWILAPDGEVLATYGNNDPSFHWDPEVNAPLVQAFLDRVEGALNAFGEITPREVKATNPYPHRGLGSRPDGSVTLAAIINGGVLDSFTFNAEDWKSFGPTKREVGFKWTIPEATGSQFSRILSPISDLGHHPPRPSDVTDIQLTGMVVEITDGVALVSYTGRFAATRKRETSASSGEMKLTGLGRYKAETGRPLALIWILEGEYRGYPPWDKPRQTEALVEWKAR